MRIFNMASVATMVAVASILTSIKLSTSSASLLTLNFQQACTDRKICTFGIPYFLLLN